MLELWEFVARLAAALVVGAPIGLEREHNHKHIGVRTFLFISLLGMLSAVFSELFHPLILVVGLAFAAGLALLAYWTRLAKEKKPGMTTSVVFLVTFLLGVAAGSGYLVESIAASIIVTLVVASKQITQSIVLHLTEKEMIESMKFGIIAFVLLPLLPNRSLDPWGFFNPYQAWFVAVLVATISFVSYVAIKVLGPAVGVGLAGILGGLVSSTAVTSAMAAKVRESAKLTDIASLAVILASSVMFLRVLILVLFISSPLLEKLLLPMAAAGLFGVAAVLLDRQLFFQKVETKLKLVSPFAFGPALKFAFFFLVTLVVSDVAENYFGSVGVYLTALLSGLTAVDAITLSIAALVAGGKLSVAVATNAIIIATAVNTVVKWGLTYYFGTPRMAAEVSKAFLLMVVALFVLGLLS